MFTDAPRSWHQQDFYRKLDKVVKMVKNLKNRVGRALKFTARSGLKLGQNSRPISLAALIILRVTPARDTV
jgi:hypothetical protein